MHVLAMLALAQSCIAKGEAALLRAHTVYPYTILALLEDEHLL